MAKFVPRSLPTPIDRSEFLAPFDSLLDTFFNDHMSSLSKSFGPDFFQRGSYPKIDIIDFSDRVEIQSEIPGLTKEDVKVEFDANTQVLAISGEKKTDTAEKAGGRYIHRELKHSSFKRTFLLGEEFVGDKIEAAFDSGLLKVTLPKKVKGEKPISPKSIAIK